MPNVRRYSTKYTGVRFIISKVMGNSRAEKIFLISYYKNGKRIEEKAGGSIRDKMNALKASAMRADRISGKQLSNREKREKREREKQIVKWTLSRLWGEYENNHVLTKGIITDRGRFKLHIERSLGEKSLKELSPLDIDRLRISLLKTKSPQTVKHCLGILKRLSYFATSRRLCEGIDFKIQMPRVSNLKTEYLNEDQLRALLKAIDEDPHPYAGPMMKMALFTGMRRGELFKLQWTDVDFDRGFIRIRSPKGGQEQIIPLNPAAQGVLETLPKSDSPFVFPGREGGQRVDIHQQIASIKKKAGLPRDFRPLHGLRHHYASMLASSGKVDMYVLQKLLTHKSPIMTQRYAHLRDEALKKASNLVGELVNEAVKQAGQGREADNVIPLQ